MRSVASALLAVAVPTLLVGGCANETRTEGEGDCARGVLYNEGQYVERGFVGQAGEIVGSGSYATCDDTSEGAQGLEFEDDGEQVDVWSIPEIPSTDAVAVEVDGSYAVLLNQALSDSERAEIIVDLELERPVPAFDLTYDGTTLALDASASRDADGEITTYRWFVDNGETETMREGRKASIEVPAGRPMAVSLQVTDDGGVSEFLTKRFAVIDVKPGEVATVNPTSTGVTPVAVLSFEGFDATALDVTTLRFGHDKVAPKATGVNRRDVDGDGTLDLVVQVPTQAMGIRPGDTSLCMTGVTRDGQSFLGCDGIRQVPKG